MQRPDPRIQSQDTQDLVPSQKPFEQKTNRTGQSVKRETLDALRLQREKKLQRKPHDRTKESGHRLSPEVMEQGRPQRPPTFRFNPESDDAKEENAS